MTVDFDVPPSPSPPPSSSFFESLRHRITRLVMSFICSFLMRNYKQVDKVLTDHACAFLTLGNSLNFVSVDPSPTYDVILKELCLSRALWPLRFARLIYFFIFLVLMWFHFFSFSCGFQGSMEFTETNFLFRSFPYFSACYFISCKFTCRCKFTGRFRIGSERRWNALSHWFQQDRALAHTPTHVCWEQEVQSGWKKSQLSEAYF